MHCVCPLPRVPRRPPPLITVEATFPVETHCCDPSSRSPRAFLGSTCSRLSPRGPLLLANPPGAPALCQLLGIQRHVLCGAPHPWVPWAGS